MVHAIPRIRKPFLGGVDGISRLVRQYRDERVPAQIRLPFPELPEYPERKMLLCPALEANLRLRSFKLLIHRHLIGCYDEVLAAVFANFLSFGHGRVSRVFIQEYHADYAYTIRDLLDSIAIVSYIHSPHAAEKEEPMDFLRVLVLSFFSGAADAAHQHATKTGKLRPLVVAIAGPLLAIPFEIAWLWRSGIPTIQPGFWSTLCVAAPLLTAAYVLRTEARRRSTAIDTAAHICLTPLFTALIAVATGTRA